MELLELYLEEIKRHLVVKNRDDIVKEIRSILIDMIDERSLDSENQPAQEIVKKVIKEYGSPKDVARQYGAENYLISPKIMPTYIQILKIVLTVVISFNLLGLLLTAINPSGININLTGVNPSLRNTNSIEMVLEVIGGLFSSLFTSFGIVTLVFAIIERTSKEQWTIETQPEWTPDDLWNQRQNKPISITGLAIEITLAFIFITLINFFIDRIGFHFLGDSGWVSFPIFNQNFFRYIPWMTGYSVMGIALNLYLIRLGHWNKNAVIGKGLVNLFTISVLVAIITGPDIFTIDSVVWQSIGIDLQVTNEAINNALNIGIKVVLGLANFGLAGDAVNQFYLHLIKGKLSRKALLND